MKGLLFKGAKRRVFAFMAAIALSFSLIGVVPARRVSAAENWVETEIIGNGDFSVDLSVEGHVWTPWKDTAAFDNATWTKDEKFHYYNGSKESEWKKFSLYQEITITKAGNYKVSLSANEKCYYSIKIDNEAVAGISVDTTSETMENYTSTSFELTAGSHGFTIEGSVPSERWGDLDDVALFVDQQYTPTVDNSPYQKGDSADLVAITVDCPSENITSVSVGTNQLEKGTNYSLPDSDTSAVITFNRTYLNGLDDKDYTATIVFKDGANTKTANFTITSAPAYIVSGDAWTYNKDLAYSDQSHSVNVDSANDKIASVKVGDATLTATTDYTLANDEGKTNLVFTETYLKSLDAGKYTATIAFNDGAADKTASFTITEYPTGLQNGGFENGIGSIGSYWNGGFAVSENDNNNNGKYLNLWVKDNGEASLVQNFKAESTGTFDISYKVIGDGNSGIAFWVNDEKIGEIEGSDYSWPEVTTTKSFDLKKDDIVKFEIKGTYSGTWAAIDDIQIVEHKDVQEELPDGLQNGDFESSKYWELSNIENKKEPFKITKDDKGGTNKTTYLDIYTTDKTNSYEIKQTFKAEESGEFVVSYSYLGSSGDTGYAMYINDTKIGTLSGNGWVGDGEWSKTTTSKFELKKDDEVTFKIKGISAEGAYFKVDDIKIEKYVPKDREFDYDTTIATGAPVDTEELYVEKLDLANGFITGADISSYASIIASGATYKDAKGNVLSDAGFFNLLKESGVNYVRIRVWVNPKDENNNYYGGGNCDVATAIKLGQYATAAKMRVLIDFHYSDFWTDPGKQNAPKAWKNLSLTDKAATLKQWTIDSLTAIIDAGVDVGMVQIGNETTTGFCGETNMTNMCTLFKAGSEGVQAVETAKNKKIMMAIHLTNPNDKDFSAYAQELKDNGVVYDVFATSFYPYWHGTLDNLYNKLSAVAKTYDKYVMVAETSYVRTLEDGDGWENTETQKKYDDGTDEFPYDISEQGQVLHIRNVIKTVSSIEGGIGVFWWEPAWIPVENWADAEDQDAVLASNKAKWETYGSGWAASAAAEYDPNVGSWYGGSAVDNESWFDFDGTALESLKVYNMVRFGTTTEDYTLGAIDAEYAFVEGEEYELPTQIEVRMASGKTSKADVTWNMDQVKEAVKQGRGTYQIDGTYTYDGVEYEDMATLNLTIKPVNLLTNGSFEDSKGEGWNFDLTHTTGIDDVEEPDGVKEEDSHDGKYTFHFYSTTPQSFEVTQTLTLEPGAYAFNGFFQGLAGVEGEIFAIVGDEEYVASYTLNGWVDWQNPEISKIIVTEKTEVTVGFRSSYSAKDWGTCDDFTLYRMGDIFTVTFENNGHGTAPEALIVVEGETIDEPDKLVADKKDQVEFTGWYTDKECKNEFDFDTKITKDITLYAGWKSTAKQTFALESSSQNVTWTSGDGNLRLVAHCEQNDAETFDHFKRAGIAKAADVAGVAKAGGDTSGCFAWLGSNQLRAESGSLRLTIFASYLETLEPGDYILRIEFDTDAIETTITIKAKEAVAPDADVKTDDKAADASVKTDDKAATNSDSAPKTGDETPVSAVMLILLISAAGLSYMLGLKREKRR